MRVYCKIISIKIIGRVRIFLWCEYIYITVRTFSDFISNFANIIIQNISRNMFKYFLQAAAFQAISFSWSIRVHLSFPAFFLIEERLFSFQSSSRIFFRLSSSIFTRILQHYSLCLVSTVFFSLLSVCVLFMISAQCQCASPGRQCRLVSGLRSSMFRVSLWQLCSPDCLRSASAVPLREYSKPRGLNVVAIKASTV